MELFKRWIDAHPECGPQHMTLEQSVTAYILTYPNRVIPMIIAWMEFGGHITKLLEAAERALHDAMQAKITAAVVNLKTGEIEKTSEPSCN